MLSYLAGDGSRLFNAKDRLSMRSWRTLYSFALRETRNAFWMSGWTPRAAASSGGVGCGGGIPGCDIKVTVWTDYLVKKSFDKVRPGMDGRLVLKEVGNLGIEGRGHEVTLVSDLENLGSLVASALTPDG